MSPLPYVLPEEEAFVPVLSSEWLSEGDVSVEMHGAEPLSVRFPLSLDTDGGRSEVRFTVFCLTGLLVGFGKRWEEPGDVVRMECKRRRTL